MTQHRLHISTIINRVGNDCTAAEKREGGNEEDGRANGNINNS